MTSTAPISGPSAPAIPPPAPLTREIKRAEVVEPATARPAEQGRNRAFGEDSLPRGLIRLDRLSMLQESGTDAQVDKGAAHDQASAADGFGDRLTEDERREVQELKRQDAEIRRHEAAHASVGGVHAGAPGFDFVTGPDGKRYAVAGHVPIDISPVAGDPDATIAKMQTVRRAALAPAEPSGQDRAVAAEAARAEAQARAEKRSGKEEDPLAPASEDEETTPANDNAFGALAAKLYGAEDDEQAPPAGQDRIEQFA
jgi:hypothetical protein